MTGDPRVVRSRAAVLDATVGLMLEGGVHATTVDAIAERAGVSKATIYRHWATRQELILDALTTQKPAPELPHRGSLREDLVALLTGLADHLASPSGAMFCSMAGAAEHDPEIAELRQLFATARGQTIRQLVVDGIERGDLRRELDVDLFIATVVGPFFYMRLVRGERVPDGWPAAVVDAALAAHGAEPLPRHEID